LQRFDIARRPLVNTGAPDPDRETAKARVLEMQTKLHRWATADPGRCSSGMNTWRAGCGESRTSGSEGGPQKPSRRKPARALRPDPYTYLASAIRGLFYRLYLIEDLFSRKIVAWEVHAEENADHASHLIERACLAEGIHRPGLVLHSDNGSPMKGATMLGTLQRLGIIPSFSRPSVSDDNPYVESLFRTLKYTPAYPNQPFASIEAARAWVARFVHWYNEEHRHSAIRYVTPGQRHRGEDIAILANRQRVYEDARRANPNRWSQQTRNWAPIEEVWLNPMKEHVQPLSPAFAQAA
jgi:putative transposase